MSKDKEEIVIIPPASTKPIRVGQIFDFINEDNPQPYLIYFGRTKCEPCNRFEDKLSQAITETKAQIYYYNTEEMPREEATEVVADLQMEYVPVLMKVSKGKVVHYTADIDTDKLIEWIRNEDEDTRKI